MKLVLTIPIFLIVTTFSSFALDLLTPHVDVKISKQAGKYRFELLGEIRNDYRKVSVIRITQLSSKKTQDIPVSDGWLASKYIKGWSPLEVHDWSLDGNKDISFYSGDSSHPNNYYLRWAFVATEGRFKHTKFSQSLDNKGVNEFDSKSGLYTAYYRSGAESNRSFYRAVGSSLVLVKSVERGYSQAWKDILPNHAEYSWVQITTFFNQDGSIRRRFHKTLKS